MLYDGFTDEFATHAHPAHVIAHPDPPFVHAPHGQIDHVASASHPAPPVWDDADVPLFPFLAIFAVQVRVKVHFTWITYPAGSRIIPVFTVRLL